MSGNAWERAEPVPPPRVRLDRAAQRIAEAIADVEAAGPRYPRVLALNSARVALRNAERWMNDARRMADSGGWEGIELPPPVSEGRRSGFGRAWLDRLLRREGM